MASKKAQNKFQNRKSDTVLAIKYFLNSWFFVPLTMLFIWMEMRISALNVAVDEDLEARVRVEPQNGTLD